MEGRRRRGRPGSHLFEWCAGLEKNSTAEQFGEDAANAPDVHLEGVMIGAHE